MIVQLNNIENDTAELGYFGFSTWEKILQYMQKGLKGLSEYKFVSTFWKNQTLINNLNREYMAMQAQGHPPVKPEAGTGYLKTWTPEAAKQGKIISKNLNIPLTLVYMYFSAIYDLSSTGKIPYEKWNPQGYIKARKQQQSIETEKGTLKKITEGITETSKTAQRVIIPIAIIAALGTGVYFYNQFKPR